MPRATTPKSLLVVENILVAHSWAEAGMDNRTVTSAACAALQYMAADSYKNAVLGIDPVLTRAMADYEWDLTRPATITCRVRCGGLCRAPRCSRTRRSCLSDMCRNYSRNRCPAGQVTKNGPCLVARSRRNLSHRA